VVEKDGKYIIVEEEALNEEAIKRFIEEEWPLIKEEQRRLKEKK
jgi:hypothetical protein